MSFIYCWCPLIIFFHSVWAYLVLGMIYNLIKTYTFWVLNFETGIYLNFCFAAFFFFLHGYKRGNTLITFSLPDGIKNPDFPLGYSWHSRLGGELLITAVLGWEFEGSISSKVFHWYFLCLWGVRVTHCCFLHGFHWHYTTGVTLLLLNGGKCHHSLLGL